MSKINILYVITKLELGGAQKQLLNLVRGLDKDKYNIFLFTAKDGSLIGEVESIEYITLIKSICLERAINPIKDLFCLAELYFCIKKNKISIVHTHSSKAGILGRLAAALAGAVKIIHTVHGWSFNDFQPYLLKRLFISLERFCGKFSDKLVVVSYWDKTKGLKNRIGDEAKYCLIHYGIDYAEFNINDLLIRRELGVSDEDLVVGMIACFKPQKCPQDFMKLAFLVVRAMPEVKFILVGDGILRRKLEGLIFEYDLTKNVILTGWRRDIPRVLSAFDVFVLTSLWEGLPVSVLEAIASFKPVVVTDTGGVRDLIIDNKTGFLVPPHNMEIFSQKIISLLENKDLRKLIALNAFDSLGSNFLNQIVVEKNQQLYYNKF
jgi:glycosyltransferase involved in cell wall biosynthesis